MLYWPLLSTANGFPGGKVSGSLVPIADNDYPEKYLRVTSSVVGAMELIAPGSDRLRAAVIDCLLLHPYHH